MKVMSRVQDEMRHMLVQERVLSPSLSQDARGVAAWWRVVGVLVGKSELIVV